jgi:DNA helicase-2/ATP-dependent DNA helicase PcrA
MIAKNQLDMSLEDILRLQFDEDDNKQYFITPADMNRNKRNTPIDLSKYSDAQIEGIKARGNVCVLASAGSGKSTMLIGRTEHLIKNDKVNDEDILLITFSRSATDNMSSKLMKKIGENNVNIGTFHSICYNMLRKEQSFFATARIMRDYDKKRMIQDIVVKDLGINTKAKEVDVGYILRFIGLQKSHMLYYTANNFIPFITSDVKYNDDEMRKIYELYEKTKIQKKMLDFDDMQYYCVRMLEKKPDILKKYQDKYKYILTDECQDTNANQIHLLQMLNKNEQMFWVGDMRQAIYGFVGSDPKFISNFDTLFKNAKILHLKTNYRCSKDIVSITNKLLKNSEEGQHKFYKDAIAYNPKHKKPTLTAYLESLNEGEGIGKKIKEIYCRDNNIPVTNDVKGNKGVTKWNDFCILTRTNAQICSIERAFMDLDIPYIIHGSVRSFFEYKEVKDMIAFLKLAFNKDNDAFERIYATPPRWLGQVFMDKLIEIGDNENIKYFDAMSGLHKDIIFKYRSGIGDLNNIYETIKPMIGKVSIDKIIRKIREITDYDAYIIGDNIDTTTDSTEKVDNLNIFCEHAEKYIDMEKFLSDIDKIIQAKDEKTQDKKDYNKIDKVNIMTAHKSKGLEYNYVFGVGIQEGMFPHIKSDLYEGGEREERRLLYVLCTRAIKELHLSYNLISRGAPCKYSRFLDDMFTQSEIDKSKEQLEYLQNGYNLKKNKDSSKKSKQNNKKYIKEDNVINLFK